MVSLVSGKAENDGTYGTEDAENGRDDCECIHKFPPSCLTAFYIEAIDVADGNVPLYHGGGVAPTGLSRHGYQEVSSVEVADAAVFGAPARPDVDALPGTGRRVGAGGGGVCCVCLYVFRGNKALDDAAVDDGGGFAPSVFGRKCENLLALPDYTDGFVALSGPFTEINGAAGTFAVERLCRVFRGSEVVLEIFIHDAPPAPLALFEVCDDYAVVLPSGLKNLPIKRAAAGLLPKVADMGNARCARAAEQGDAGELRKAHESEVFLGSALAAAPVGEVVASLCVDADSGLLFVKDFGKTITVVDAMSNPFLVVFVVAFPLVAVAALGSGSDVIVRGRAAVASHDVAVLACWPLSRWSLLRGLRSCAGSLKS